MGEVPGALGTDQPPLRLLLEPAFPSVGRLSRILGSDSESIAISRHEMSIARRRRRSTAVTIDRDHLTALAIATFNAHLKLARYLFDRLF